MLGRLFLRIVDAQAVWSRPLGDFNHRWLSAVFRPLGPIKDLLHGRWLGHPLHAAVTDIPIGTLMSRLGRARAALRAFESGQDIPQSALGKPRPNLRIIGGSRE